jgi:hypothetical protein
MTPTGAIELINRSTGFDWLLDILIATEYSLLLWSFPA